MKMSLVPKSTEIHLCRSPSNIPRLPSFLQLLQNPRVLLTFRKVQNPLRLPHKTALERPKVIRTWCVFSHFSVDMCFAPQRLRAAAASHIPKVVRSCGVFNILTLKCASRHNGVQFLTNSISKSVSNVVCFADFDLEMCFTPQRHALFPHRNFQKRSEHGVLFAFGLRNMLRTTRARTF